MCNLVSVLIKTRTRENRGYSISGSNLTVQNNHYTILFVEHGLHIPFFNFIGWYRFKVIEKNPFIHFFFSSLNFIQGTFELSFKMIELLETSDGWSIL